jgi:hypothetical protein
MTPRSFSSSTGPSASGAAEEVAGAGDLGYIRIMTPSASTSIVRLFRLAMLDNVLTGIGDNEVDENNCIVRMRIGKSDLDNAAFAWCNVASRAEDLKTAFYAASKEGK